MLFMKKYLKLLAIEPLYDMDLQPKEEKELLRIINEKDNTPLLTVDRKEGKFDEYVLLNGYPYYHAMLQAFPDQMVLCNVVSLKNRTGGLYKALDDELNSVEADQQTLHYIIWELTKEAETKEVIAEKMGCDVDEIYFLMLDPQVPAKFREDTFHQAKVSLMNYICKSESIEEPMKETLYNWVLYPKDPSNPLTMDKLRKIDMIFENLDEEKVNKYMLEAFLEGYAKNPGPRFYDAWQSNPFKEFFISK